MVKEVKKVANYIIVDDYEVTYTPRDEVYERNSKADTLEEAMENARDSLTEYSNGGNKYIAKVIKKVSNKPAEALPVITEDIT